MTTSVRTIVRAAVFLAATLLAAVPAQADLPVSCTNFTDTPLAAGTLIKAVHLTQLRTCVNELRAERALGPASWTDATIVTQVTVVKAVHITELRAALGDAYLVTGHAAPLFGAAPVAGQTVIAASFFTDLRSAIADTPNPCVVSLSPPSLTVGQAGGSASVTLQAPCPWTASSSAAWLTLTVTTSSGSQTLGFSYEANPGLQRQASIIVNGVVVTVTQPGAGDPVALVNADFEEGFSAVGGEGNPGLLANGWGYMGDPNWVLFDRAGVPGDYEQFIERGILFQNITVQPETTYVVTADVQVDGSPGSAAKLYMHMTGFVQYAEEVSFGGGASRMRLEYHTPAGPTGENNARIGLYAASGTFRVDHVQVVPQSWETAHERVTNGDFEAGFRNYTPTGSSGVLAHDWERFGVSSGAVVFSFEESNTGLQQTIEGANVGDGIGQTVTVVPRQPYLLRANVTVASAARLGIGPVGAAATHTVGLCSSGGLPRALSLLYTPPAGQTSVTVSVAGAWQAGGTSFSVDAVSLMPTTLTSVDPGAAQGGNCVPRHRLTFQVNDPATQEPVEGALVEIAPNWGTGPAQFTYGDGTISYQVGDGSLTYVISKAGYVTKVGSFDTSGVGTWAVPMETSDCRATLSHEAAAFLMSGGSHSVDLQIASHCSWNAVPLAPWITVSPASGTGSAPVVITADPSTEAREGRVTIGGGRVTAIQGASSHFTDQASSGQPHTQLINNGHLGIAIDLTHGGAITDVIIRASAQAGLVAWRTNVVDNADPSGRQIQISLYDSDQLGTSNPACFPFPNDCEWGWNPVQAGSANLQGTPTILLEHTSSRIVTQSEMVKQWRPLFGYANVKLKQTIELISENTARVDLEITNNEAFAWGQQSRHEFPVAYLSSYFDTAFGRTSENCSPFCNLLNDESWNYYLIEPWMARTDRYGFALAIYNAPNSNSFWRSGTRGQWNQFGHTYFIQNWPELTWQPGETKLLSYCVVVGQTLDIVYAEIQRLASQ